MLYSSKKEINTLAEHGDPELEERGEQEEEVERTVSSPGEPERKLDPLNGLDEPTRICFLVRPQASSCGHRRASEECMLFYWGYFSARLQGNALGIHFLKPHSVWCWSP